jgi:hypothetical protein
MLTKTAIGLALVLATVSGTLADTKTPRNILPSQNVYNPAGAYVGTDPDARIRFELNRDWDRGR